jgi:uncharacterized protein
MIQIKTKHFLAGFIAAFALCCALPQSALAQDLPQKLPMVSVSAGMHIIHAMLAQTPNERGIGLMHRKEMGANEGMLFVFEQPSTQCFWMKNTPLPLSAAFITDDGRIVNIEDMKPHSTDSHCSKEPVRFVLEMHQGWFAKKGLKPGSTLTGKPFTR